MGKKYIIELEDKPFHNGNGDFLYRVKGFNSLVFDRNGLNMLTPYTEPDTEAICNEAYQKGYKEGCDAKFRRLTGSEYQRGLSDAWEAARKVTQVRKYGGYGDCLGDVFGRTDTSWDVFDYSASEAIEKIRTYEKKKEEKIAKGDVVRMKSAPEVEILVTYADEEYVSGIALTEVDDCCEIGDQYTDIVIHKVEKAGRHYEIAEVLKKMRETTT